MANIVDFGNKKLNIEDIEEREKELLRRIDLSVDNGSSADENDVIELIKLMKESSSDNMNFIKGTVDAMCSLTESEMKSGFIAADHKEKISEKVFNDKEVNWMPSKEEYEKGLKMAREVIFG